MLSFCSIDPHFWGDYLGLLNFPKCELDWSACNTLIAPTGDALPACWLGEQLPWGSACWLGEQLPRGAAVPTWECSERGLSPGGALLLTLHVGTCRHERRGPGFESDAIWVLNTVSGTKLQIQCENFVAVGLIQLVPLLNLVWSEMNGPQSKGMHAHLPDSLHPWWRQRQRGHWHAGTDTFPHQWGKAGEEGSIQTGLALRNDGKRNRSYLQRVE